MENTAVATPPKKGGFTSENNPNKKVSRAEGDTFLGFTIDPKRRYWFKLIQTYEKLKPRDATTGLPVDSLYPSLKSVPNEGVAFYKGDMRRWRYLYGYATIWVDEQTSPEPTIQNISDARNDIIFREGNLFAPGSNKAMVMALLVQDEYEGNEQSVTNTPKTFKLINQEDTLNIASESADKAFEAETAARAASMDELLPLALLFGLNIDDAENRQEIIKKEMILKARQLPDAFLKAFVAPKTKIKYLVTKALQANIINADTGRIVMVETGKVLFGIDNKKDVAEQVAALVMSSDEEASLLYAQIQKVLS